MDLDIEVSKALFGVTLMERALHDPRPWSARWAGRTAPLAREVVPGGVNLHCTFTDYCLLGDPDPVVEVEVEGEVIACRPIAHPGDGGFTLDWTLTLDVQLAAA